MKFLLREELLHEQSIEIHDELNPVLWSNNRLRPEVREKIIALVQEFQTTLDIPLSIIDINIVGSNASYNYTAKSDVDVHIITNFEEYGQPRELVDAAMNAFRSNFNKRYDVDYKGYNVELYVEDVKSSPQSNGIYSIVQNDWIKVPTKLEPIDVDLEPEYSELTARIHNLISVGTESDILNMIDELYLIRRNSLVVDGEFGKGNLIFKQLRNDGLLDALKDRRVELASHELSI